MRPLKICDIVTIREIVDKDKSDYNKGHKSLSECEFIDYSREIYKIIDVDFIKYIEFDKGPYFKVFFKDGTDIELDKIHLDRIISSLER